MKGFDKASMVRRNKLINNLPRYDLGTTPINRGYQSASNSIPSPFVSQAGQNLSQMVSGQKQANTAQMVNSGAQLATQAVGIADVAKQLSTGAIKSGTAAMLSAASTIPSAMQLYDAINTKGSFDGLGGNDLDMLASKNTEYRNGVAYENIGGVDSNNIMKAARAREFGENMNLTTNAIGTGAGVGAAIGSFFPGAGNLIGAGIGALVGGLGSLLGWNNDEVKEQRRRLQNWRIASNAANTQNEAVADSTGLRNEFYATHADQGLSPAYLSGGETKVNTDGEGNVTNFEYFPVTPATPMHADNILTSVGENDGVFGRIKNKRTGRMYMTDASKIVHDPTLPKPDKNNLLTQLLWEQDIDLKGKNANMKIGRFDRGRYMGLLSMIPGIMEWTTGQKQENYYKTQPPAANNPATINNNAAAAQAKLDALHYSPYNLYRNLYRLNKQQIYNLNNASISPGMRQALRNQYTSDLAYHLADINSQAQQINNQYAANAAKTALETGEADAQRRMVGQTEYNKGIANAVARQLKGIETGWQTKLKGVNTAFGNWLNNYWTDRTIGLYDQQTRAEIAKILAGINDDKKQQAVQPIKNNYTTPIRAIPQTLVFNPNADNDLANAYYWMNLGK